MDIVGDLNNDDPQAHSSEGCACALHGDASSYVAQDDEDSKDDYDPTQDISMCECGYRVPYCECSIDEEDSEDYDDEEEDDWDPDAPDPCFVEHGLEKTTFGLSIALSFTDDNTIKELLE